MRNLVLPDLTFPGVVFGVNVTPWDLRCLLYRGGASARRNKVAGLIGQGALGPPILERLELVVKLHDEIAGKLAGGGSKHSAQSTIDHLRVFFGWAEQAGRVLNLDTVVTTYIHWTDHLLNRCRVIRDMSEIGIYSSAYSVANVLDGVLQHHISLIGATRIRRPRNGKVALGIEADKQNLQDTFTFGFAMLDICHALTVDAVRGPVPVRIPFRNGAVLEEWAGKQPIETRKWSASPKTPSQRFNAKKFRQLREVWEADTSLRTRHSIANLRVEAELLIFIAQTGINLAQAHRLKAGQFHYTSHLDGYQVRMYKNRRSGEVEFEIYTEYRDIFERYIAWREIMFPNDPNGQLFQMAKVSRAEDVGPKFHRARATCKKLGIRFINPSLLRNTRINWLLRRSRDPEMTAAMAQHTQQTLLQRYAKPNLQVAMVEIARFHDQTDPAISPPGPGLCVSRTPEPMSDIPGNAAPPDCLTAAGCLFCTHHRDIDSEDHVWSLTSFRYLKSLELERYRPPARKTSHASTHPAVAAIDRATAKLKFFKDSNAVRGMWVNEALARIEEGDYHPAWDGFIQILELRL